MINCPPLPTLTSVFPSEENRKAEAVSYTSGNKTSRRWLSPTIGLSTHQSENLHHYWQGNDHPGKKQGIDTHL